MLDYYGLPPDAEEVPDWLVVAELNEDEERLAEWVEEAGLLRDLPPSHRVPPPAPAPVAPVPAVPPPAARPTPRSLGACSDMLPPDVLVEARVLGPVELVGWRQAPERQVVTELCCYLALHGERPVTGDVLLAALWPEGRREAGTKSLRTYLSLLRRSLGPDLFPEAEKGAGYQLDPAVTTDWYSFETLRHDADACEAGGDEATAALLLRRALQLVRGTPFAGVPAGSYSWAWTELLVSQIEQAVADAALRLAHHATGEGDHELADWATRRGLRAVPFDVRLWDTLVATAGKLSSTARLQALRDRAAVLGEDAAAPSGRPGNGDAPGRGLNVRGRGLGD